MLNYHIFCDRVRLRARNTVITSFSFPGGSKSPSVGFRGQCWCLPPSIRVIQCERKTTSEEPKGGQGGHFLNSFPKLIANRSRFLKQNPLKSDYNPWLSPSVWSDTNDFKSPAKGKENERDGASLSVPGLPHVLTQQSECYTFKRKEKKKSWKKKSQTQSWKPIACSSANWSLFLKSH